MYLHFFVFINFLLRIAFAVEITENSTQIENMFEELKSKNESVSSSNHTNSLNDSFIETERIIKPMTLQAQSQTQRINKILNNTVSEKKHKIDFKPSPQLEIEYEYNKFPVVPAFPEAKHLSGRNEAINLPWAEKDYKPTEPPWISRVRFPTQGASVHVEHPYPFYQGNDEIKSSRVKTYPQKVS